MEILFDPKYYVIGLAMLAWAGLLSLWPVDASKVYLHAGLLVVIAQIIGLDPSHPVVFAAGSWLLQIAFFFWYAAASVGRRLYGRGEFHRPYQIAGLLFLGAGLLLQTLHLVGVESPEGLTWEAVDRVVPYWLVLTVVHIVGGRVFGLGMIRAMSREEEAFRPPRGSHGNP